MKLIYPDINMKFYNISNEKYFVEVKWTRNLFEDYKKLAINFYRSGILIFEEIIKDDNNYIRTDTWFLTCIFLLRQSIELALKSIIIRENIKKKNIIQDEFLKDKHCVDMLFNFCKDKEKYLEPEEIMWIKAYLIDLNKIDSKSDIFRYPFPNDFMEKYGDMFLNNRDIIKNMNQAYQIIMKYIDYGIQDPEYKFSSKLKPEFLIEAQHGIGNCAIYQSKSDKGFYSKINGYSETAEFILKNEEITNEEKTYPLLFALRNTIELSLKRIINKQSGFLIDRKKFFRIRNSHKLKKDLWKNIYPILEEEAIRRLWDRKDLDIVNSMISCIDNLDNNGDMFRYPTSYSLEYRFDERELDLLNVFEYMVAIITFLDGCDSMLDNEY